MVLNALGKTKIILGISVCTLVANVVLNITLTQLIGFSGAALATVGVILLQAYLTLHFSSKQINIPIRNLFPWKAIAILIGINLTGGVLVFTIVRLLRLGTDATGILTAVGIGIAWVALYALVLRKRLMKLWRSMNRLEEPHE